MLIDEDLLTGINLVDRISVPTKRELNDQGQMLVPCAFARTGTQLYTAKQLGLRDVAPNKIITVYREEKDVFDQASMDTFRSAPVTIGHPRDASGKSIPVTSANSKELQVGVLEGMPTRDEDTLGGVLVLTAQEAIDALEEGTQELSAGYTCDIELVDGKYYQRNIVANHIALVNKGRAGSNCRISDEADEARLADEHPEPMRWDFMNDEAYESAMVCWNLVESAQFKAALVSGQVAVDEAVLLADAELLTDALAEVETQKGLVVELKSSIEATDIALEETKALLADAKVAAEQGVVERCLAMENARLIADIRDLGDKSVEQIHKLVVEDQMPEKDLTGKSSAYLSAMFEILVDASQGETPMSKLLKKQDLADTTLVVAPKKADAVLNARQRSIARNKAS